MFSKATFCFLDELAVNNNRAWFELNKPRYEELVREPAMEFIAEMGLALESFAPHFKADLRKVGGSLMRVARDTRFSRNKSPYKTNIGIQFRHHCGKDVHTPGFYVHLANDECFLGVGCWKPDSDALGLIRDLVAKRPEKWFSVRDNKKFVEHWTLSGDTLNRPPRGYDAVHLAIDDLKRKDFIGVSPVLRRNIVKGNLTKLAAENFASAAPFMKFLGTALKLDY